MRKFSETDPITGDSIALDDPFFVLNKSQTSGPQSGPGGTVRSVTKQQLLGRGSQVIRLFLPEDATQIGLLSRVASHIDDIPTTADTVITRDTYFWVQLFIDGVVTDVYFQNIKGFGSYGTTGDLQFAQTFFNPIGLIQHFPISTTIFVDNDPNNTPNSLTEVVNILNASDDIPITTFGNQIFYVVNGVPTVYEYTGGNTIIGSGQTPIVEGDLTVVDGVVFDATPQDFQTSADQVPVDGTPEFHPLPQGDDTVFGWLTGNDKNWGWLLQQYAIQGVFGGYYETINGAGTNLFNSQGSQVIGNLYLVRDASFDTNVTSGFGLYKYLGTTVGDLTDYEFQNISFESSLSYDTTNLKVVVESDPQAYVEANDIALLNARTTGIRFGGQTSVNGGLGVGSGLDITSGGGQILDNTDPNNQFYTPISWNALTDVQLDTNTPFVTYWYFDDNSGNAQQTTSKPTRDQFSTRIYVAVTSVTNGIITGLQSLVTPTQQLGQRIAGLANALGILREDGLNVQTAGANLNVKVSSGRYYKYGSNWNASNTSPDNALFAGIDTSVAGDIRYVIPSGIIATDVTEYDVANYAPNGTVTAIPGNFVQDRFGYHFLIGFPGNDEIRITYGSTFYTSLQDSLDDLQNIDVFSLVPSAFRGAAFLIGVLIVEKDATDIDQALADGDAVFKTTNTFGFFGGGTSQAGSGFLEANLNLSDLTDVIAALNTLFGVPANDNQVIVRDSDGSTRYEDYNTGSVEAEPFIGDIIFDQEFVLNDAKRSFVNKTSVVQGGETIQGRVVNTFRIPSIAILPNGNIFATCEARIPSESDEAEAELYYAILNNKQVTEEGFLIDKGANNKVNNPKMVVKNNILYVFYTIFDVGGIIDSNTTTTSLFYITSSDNAQTFTSPVEILPGDQDVNSVFKYMNSPSKAILAPSGEIIIPIWGKDFSESTDRTDPIVYRSGIILFDTVANTFVKKILPNKMIAEPVCYFDSADNLVIDNRVLGTNDDTRQVYYSTDLGDTWNDHVSTGRATSPVYVDLVAYRNNVIRAEIGLGLTSGVRKNLDLLIGDTNNQNYTKISNLTVREDLIWGYTSLDKVGDNVFILSEDRPNINFYDFNVIDDPYDVFYIDSNPVLNVLYNLEPEGTTLDASRIFIDADSPDVVTTQQTGAIIMTDQTTGAGATETLSTEGLFDDNFTGLERFIYLRITKANDSFCQFVIDDLLGGISDAISLRTSDQENNDIRLKITDNTGATTYDQSVVGVSFDGSFKIRLFNSNVQVFKWDGTAYVQHFSQPTNEFEYFFRFFRGINFVSGETTELNRITVLTEDWIGETPA